MSEFHFKAECIPLYVCSIFRAFRHLGCFYLLATVNNVAVNRGVQISIVVSAFSSLGVYAQKGKPHFKNTGSSLCLQSGLIPV